MRTRITLAAAALLAAGAHLGALAATEADVKAPASRADDEAAKIAEDAYIFGYPLVLMDVTKAVSTAVPKPEGTKAPINQFAHVRAFPDATYTDIVSPNADTLYSLAWLDLAKEPIVLSVPEVGKRFYLMQIMDDRTNVFANPGTRTTGGGEGRFAIVGPQWTGKLPAGVEELRSPTNTVWICGRTQTDGKEDHPAVRAIQDQYELIPLSAWGKNHISRSDVPVAEGVDAKTPGPMQVAKMDPATFFARLNTVMKDNPPAYVDADAMKRFAAIGVAPGKAFEPAKLDPAVAEAVEEGVRAARELLVAEAKKPFGKSVNNWSITTEGIGRYGTNYLFRSVIALVGLGTNLPEDATYPLTRVDAEGNALTGAKRYEIRFAKEQLPPVGAFWSLTLYNSKQNFVDNPIDRYAIGDRDKLQIGADGSLTLYVQKESPGKEKESNWLPAPSDEFNLVMRLYWPEKEILDGTWKPPAVERVK